MAKLNSIETAPAAGHDVLQPGDSYYQVLEPSAVLGPGGVAQFSMVGPFAEIVSASNYAQSRPGAYVTVTLVLHQVPAAGPPAAAQLAKR